MDIILIVHFLKLRVHEVLFIIYWFWNPINRINYSSEGIQDSFIIIVIWIILRLDVTQGSNKGLALSNGLEICWTFLFHMSKTLTSETLWFRGNNVLIAFLSILLPSILALELWRTGLLTILVESFCIGILHKFLELPGDVGFHFGIFIIRELIRITAFGLQCHALALAWFPDPSQTQFIGLQVAN